MKGLLLALALLPLAATAQTDQTKIPLPTSCQSPEEKVLLAYVVSQSGVNVDSAVSIKTFDAQDPYFMSPRDRARPHLSCAFTIIYRDEYARRLEQGGLLKLWLDDNGQLQDSLVSSPVRPSL